MSHRLKILHVLSSWESGAARECAAFAAAFAAASAAAFPRDEFESEICVLAGPAHQRVPDVPTTTLGLRWSFDVSASLGLRRILRRFRPEIIHTWDAASHCYGAMLSGSLRVLAEKREPAIPSGWWQEWIDRKTYRFIVPRENSGFPASQTIVIPPAAVPVPCSDPIPAATLLAKMELPLATPSKDYTPVFQSQLGYQRNKPLSPQDAPLLIGIALPLCTEHRILDALWVFETLNHVHLNFHAFFIGDGKDRELCLRSRDRWQLSSRVHFLGSRPDLERLLPSFDALLHLSPSAEHSGTILSAMSCGVPVIALETPESQEYILDGMTGILIPREGDFRFYRRTAAKRLLYLLENVELRRSMQIAAKDRVEQKFNFDAAVQKRIQAYREL